MKRLLTTLVPPVRSLQLQRDALARQVGTLNIAVAQARNAAVSCESALAQCRATSQSAEAAAGEPKAALADAQALIAKLRAAPHHHFMGYDIPVELLNLTGGGTATFAVISQQHTANLKKWIGLAPMHNVLEIGCGIGRDAIPLSEFLTEGTYLGVDIIGRSIDWCTQNIAARHANFRFVHYDVADQLHNNAGSTRTTEIVLPLEDGSIDSIFLFSVFTHMLQADIEHYLREFRRVLKPGGLVYATTFIYDDAILAKARATNLTIFDLRFEHTLSPVCRINDPVHPLGAVAYTAQGWAEMCAASGMRQSREPLHGAWSGFYDDAPDGQDVMILTRA